MYKITLGSQNDHYIDPYELGPVVLYYALSIDPPPLQLLRRKNLSPNSLAQETAEGQNFVLPQKIFFPVLP